MVSTVWVRLFFLLLTAVIINRWSWICHFKIRVHCTKSDSEWKEVYSCNQRFNSWNEHKQDIQTTTTVETKDFALMYNCLLSDRQRGDSRLTVRLRDNKNHHIVKLVHFSLLTLRKLHNMSNIYYYWNIKKRFNFTIQIKFNWLIDWLIDWV